MNKRKDSSAVFDLCGAVVDRVCECLAIVVAPHEVSLANLHGVGDDTIGDSSGWLEGTNLSIRSILLHVQYVSNVRISDLGNW